MSDARTIVERLGHFEKHQIEQGDEYGAEVLHRAADHIEAQAAENARLEEVISLLQSSVQRLRKELAGVTWGRDQNAADCERLEAENTRLREALGFYMEKAEALGRYSAQKKGAAIEAVMVELINDGGKRAARALLTDIKEEG